MSDNTRLYYDETTKFLSNGYEVVGSVNIHGDIAMNDGTVCTVNHFGDVVDSNGNVRGSAREGKLVLFPQPEPQEQVGLGSSSSWSGPLLSKETKRKIFITFVCIGLLAPIVFVVAMSAGVIAEGGNVLIAIAVGILFVLGALVPVAVSVFVIYYFFVRKKK